jgi:hypothetical protein
VLEIDDKGDLLSKIGRTQDSSYQGGGGYKTNVDTSEAEFNTPVGVAFDSKNNIYIADLFNGLIRTVNDGFVNDYNHSSPPNSYIWPTSIEVINSELFIADGLSKKVYREKHIKNIH